MTPLEAMKQAVDYLRLARDYGIALGVGNTTITDAINNQLTAIEQMETPGWKLVPLEPTEEMIDAIYSDLVIGESGYRAVYKRMLAASPTPEGEK